MRGLKENSPSQKILIKLSEILELAGILIFWNYKEFYRITGMGPLYTDSRQHYPIPKYIDSLKRRDYIQAIKTKKGKKIKLTPKGQAEIIKYKIKLKTEKPKWNGKWFGISWDVPEISRKDRDYLRNQLRWLGFKELQKSLWVFPFDIENEVKELSKLYKENLAGDIRFLIIEKVKKDSDLKKYFNLT